MVMELTTWIQILDETFWISLDVIVLKKDMNPSHLSLKIGE